MDSTTNNRLWNKWREMKMEQNRMAEAAALLLSEGYTKARGLKKVYLTLKYFWLDTHGQFNLPKNEIEALARCFLPDILAYFESEEGKAEFAAWKAEQEKLKLEEEKKKTTHSPSRMYP